MAKLCKSRKVVNSSVKPKRWYYGLEHCRSWAFSAVPAGETYEPLNLMGENYEEINGYVWFTNGGADPAPVGLTLIATVDATAAATVPGLLAAIKVALDASPSADLMQTQVSADDVEIFNNFVGLVTEEVAQEVTTTITVGQQSFGQALNVLTEDGASASFEIETLDQTGDATGNAIVESFLINVLATITLSMTDTSRESFKELFIKPLGGVYTNGPDEIIGFGTGNFFTSLMTKKAGKLVGHDASAAFSDRTNDWVMLALIKPASINFNKEIQALEVEFTSLYDATAPEEVNIFRIGDMTKIDLAAL